jgi:hypothetical protein
MYVHDMSILIIPLLVTLNQLRTSTPGRYARAQAIAAFLLVASVPCLIFALSYFWLAVLPVLVFAILTAIRPPVANDGNLPLNEQRSSLV